MRPFQVVLATDSHLGIGKESGIPWNCREDMKLFKEITNNTYLIMGRITYESMLTANVNWGTRVPVVVSSKYKYKNLEDAINSCIDKTKTINVIGGKRLFEEALLSPLCYKVYWSYINGNYDCDVKLDTSVLKYIQSNMERRIVRIYRKFRCILYFKVNYEERQYLKLCEDIINQGNHQIYSDRTGTGTISTFGSRMKFNLSGDTFPLLTTKRVFWKAVVEELLWMLRGSTDANELSEKGIKIWNGNSRGLTEYKEGDIGPGYGFQWRHWGAKYLGKDHDYTGQGRDQIARILHLIRTDPHNRRIILSAWNVSCLEEMVLPPCHMLCQFYVRDGVLSSQLYQRSGDMGLGIPFNIASYALLTRIIAHMTGLKAGEFIHIIGDTHVYANHIDPLKQQIAREPLPFPTMTIDNNAPTEDIGKWKPEHFTITNYCSYPKINMEMAV
jgi:dihydrofolate reductase/thymidylate synthase